MAIQFTRHRNHPPRKRSGSDRTNDRVRGDRVERLFGHRAVERAAVETLESRRLFSGIVFPSDAGVIDVTTYGAIPGDNIDDTAAIQDALDDYPSGNTVFYFPDGVYNISGTLMPALDDGVTKRNIFQGQSRTGAILKLTDNLGFTGAVIDFRSGPAQFFRNAVRDLTIDIGVGNPAATGLRFNASNQGVVHDVNIISGDGSGFVGLDLATAGEPGPLFIKDVAVTGFDYGIRTAAQTASQTFEYITLTDQNIYGFLNYSTQSTFIRGIEFTGEVTAIANIPAFSTAGEGRMVVIDGVLNHTGPTGPSTFAIRNQKSIYVRNVYTTGYGGDISREIASFRGNVGTYGGYIEEYWGNGAYAGNDRRGGVYELFESQDAMINHVPEDEPLIPWDDLADWDGPQNYGAFPNDGIDDTAAIQAAIDSGAGTVYLPNGTWTLDGTIYLRENVRRFMGTEAAIEGNGTIELVDDVGSPPAVSVERLEVKAGSDIKFKPNSERDWVVQNILGGRFVETSYTGELGILFLNDVAIGASVFKNQMVEARQLNVETNTEGSSVYEAKLVNDGGGLWILGLKTEDPGTAILTRNGGGTEVLGALHVGAFGTDEYFIVDESVMTAAITGNVSIKETRDGVTLTGSMGNADVYSARRNDYRRVFQVDTGDSVGATVSGTWSSTTSYQGGWIDSDALYASPSASNYVTFDFDGIEGVWEVYGRWMADNSGQNHSGHATNATFEINHYYGQTNVVKNQKLDYGRWVSLGQYTFDEGIGNVVVRTVGANGKVMADAIRFVRVGEFEPIALMSGGGESSSSAPAEPSSAAVFSSTPIEATQSAIASPEATLSTAAPPSVSSSLFATEDEEQLPDVLG